MKELRLFAKFGLPGLGLGVFLLVIRDFIGEIFKHLDSTEGALIALVLLSLIGGVTAFVLTRPNENQIARDNVKPLVQALLGTPESGKKCLELIAMIAKSKDPRKRVYLMQLFAHDKLSELEREALRAILDMPKPEEKVDALFARLTERKRQDLEKTVPSDMDATTASALCALQYWLYTMRKDHKHFIETKNLIIRASVTGSFDSTKLRKLEQETL